MADPFLGEIRMVAFNFAPTGWLQANGQTLNVQQYNALFALYGATFGGNGSTTFMLPDLRGRTPLGALPATYNQGHSAGTETVTLTATTMPLHVHYLSGNTAAADQTGGSGHYLASVDESAQAPRVNLYQPTPPSPATTPLNPAGIQTVGASAGHQNMQPYLTIDFLVATTGLWPSRP